MRPARDPSELGSDRGELGAQYREQPGDAAGERRQHHDKDCQDHHDQDRVFRRRDPASVGDEPLCQIAHEILPRSGRRRVAHAAPIQLLGEAIVSQKFAPGRSASSTSPSGPAAATAFESAAYPRKRERGAGPPEQRNPAQFGAVGRYRADPLTRGRVRHRRRRSRRRPAGRPVPAATGAPTQSLSARRWRRPEYRQGNVRRRSEA